MFTLFHSTFRRSISRKTTPLVLYTVPFDISGLIYFARSYTACIYTVPFEIWLIYFAKNYTACTLHCPIRHLADLFRQKLHRLCLHCSNGHLGLCCTVRHFNVLFQYRELTQLVVLSAAMKNEPKLLIAADKTTNFYKLEPCTYNDLLEKNIRKSYKKALPETTQAIHKENKDIATKLGIDDRVDATASKDAFITLKDHKPNFANKPTCRLINPTKSEIGKVSKKILDRINSTIAKKHNLHQWKNTAAVIDWCKSINNKQRLSFICFDIEEFYPSISQDLLIKALDFASDYDNITTDERNIIIHAKSSILIHNHQPWQKKGNTTFDVTMGSYDGAETCELVGNFLLSQLQDLNVNVGLYRDDGLAITDATPRDAENIKKEICRIFNNNGLRITIEANKQVINFLDVTFNLNRSSYQPFTKPNTSLQYVHRESNHPPITTKNIPAGINKRLSSLSSDKTSFDQAAPPIPKSARRKRIPLYSKLRTKCAHQAKKQTTEQHTLVQPPIQQKC